MLIIYGIMIGAFKKKNQSKLEIRVFIPSGVIFL
jgi:hypothetical protein